VKASPETRSELGVAIWGASPSPADADTARFTGYDVNGKPIVVIDRRDAVVDEMHHVTEIAVDGSLAHGVFRMEGTMAPSHTGNENEVDITVEVTENTIVESPRAQAVLDRMSADFAKTTSDEPVSLVQQGLTLDESGGLRPSGLVGRCVEVLKKCGANLIQWVKDAGPCVKLVKNVVGILTCARYAGVWGVVGCGIWKAPKTVMNAIDCVKKAKELYETGRERWEQTKQACNFSNGCRGSSESTEEKK
jgi:hypothetical protein